MKSKLQPQDFYIRSFSLNGFRPFALLHVVFLWDFLNYGELEKSAIVGIILGLKFLFDSVIDILSSAYADLWKATRRKVLLMGMSLQTAGILVYVGFPLWPKEPSSLVVVVTMAYFIRSIGNAMVSGNWDGWTVSAQKSLDPTFNKTTMFAQARVIERVVLLVSSFIAVLSLVVVVKYGSVDAVKTFWFCLFGVSFLVKCILVGYTYFHTKGYDEEIHAGKTPPLKIVFKKALAPSSLPSLGIVTCLYAIAMIFNFAWPNFVSLVGSKPEAYLLMPVMMIITVFGSKSAVRLSKTISEKEILKNVEIYTLIIGVSGFFVGLSLLGKVDGALWATLLGLIGLCFIRYYYFFAKPFAETLIHKLDDEDENFRAAIVSTREATFGISVSALFLIGNFLTSRLSLSKEQGTGVMFCMVSASIVVFLLLVFIFRRKRLTQN